MKQRLTNLLLVLLFLAGLGILLYPAVSNYWNSKVQSGVITNYESVLQTMKGEDTAAYFEAADAFNEKLLTMAQPLHHVKELTEYRDILNLPGTDIMGYLAIDKIKVELPIYHGTDPGVLAVGAGHLEGTSVPVGGSGTHCALSAHRGLPSAKLFSDLDKLEVGDLFTITVLDRRITYQVDQIRIVLPKEMDDLAIQPGEDYCTLVTCTPYGINTHRMLVRGTRVDNVEEKPQIFVPNEAVSIDPRIVALFVAIPLMLLLTVYLMIKYRKKKS